MMCRKADSCSTFPVQDEESSREQVFDDGMCAFVILTASVKDAKGKQKAAEDKCMVPEYGSSSSSSLSRLPKGPAPDPSSSPSPLRVIKAKRKRAEKTHGNEEAAVEDRCRKQAGRSRSKKSSRHKAACHLEGECGARQNR